MGPAMALPATGTKSAIGSAVLWTAEAAACPGAEICSLSLLWTFSVMSKLRGTGAGKRGGGGGGGASKSLVSPKRWDCGTKGAASARRALDGLGEARVMSGLGLGRPIMFSQSPTSGRPPGSGVVSLIGRICCSKEGPKFPGRRKNDLILGCGGLPCSALRALYISRMGTCQK